MSNLVFPVDGFLIIDKAPDWTSHDVVAKLRGITGIRGIGHAGTLDPFATGVLVVAVGEATKLLEFLTGFPKTYEAVFHLGATSDTDDRTGSITETPSAQSPSRGQLEEAVAHFRGTISQTPPQYSAVKVGGQRLYALARKGKTTVVKPRAVTVHTFDIVDYAYPLLTVRLSVSSGTYIRAIARDLGAALSVGGYVEELRRTSVGPFTAAEAVPLASLTSDTWQQSLRPLTDGIAQLPHVTVREEDARRLRAGQRVSVVSVPASGSVAVLDTHGALVCIAHGNSVDHTLQPRKVFVFPT